MRTTILGLSLLALSPFASAQDYFFLPAVGGDGGSPFRMAPPNGSPVLNHAFYSGKYVDNVSTRWHSRSSGWMGGSQRAKLTRLDLDWTRGEYLRSVTVYHGRLVDGLLMITSHNRRVAIGNLKGRGTTFSIPGCEIVGFHGRIGKYVDKLGVIMRARQVTITTAGTGCAGFAANAVTPRGRIRTLWLRANAKAANTPIVWLASQQTTNAKLPFANCNLLVPPHLTWTTITRGSTSSLYVRIPLVFAKFHLQIAALYPATHVVDLSARKTVSMPR